MSSWILNLGQAGVMLADLSPRIYEHDGALVAGTAGLSLTPIPDTLTYELRAELPRPATGRWTVTIDRPAGFGSAFTTPDDQPPELVIVPVRQTGLDLEIASVLIRDAALDPAALTVGEMVIGGGDYGVSGWPINVNAGAYSLTFAYGGYSYPPVTWFDPGPLGAGSCAVDIIAAAVDDVFAELGTLAQLTIRHYTRVPSASTGRTTKTLSGGYPKAVDGIIAERFSRYGGYMRQALIRGADLGGGHDLPDGDWTVQEPGGPELRTDGPFRSMGLSVDSVALWRATITGGAESRSAR